MFVLQICTPRQIRLLVDTVCHSTSLDVGHVKDLTTRPVLFDDLKPNKEVELSFSSSMASSRS